MKQQKSTAEGNPRRDTGLEQRDLAEKIHVSEVTMSRWINGIRQPIAYGLYRIAKVFGVSMEELMEGIEDD